MEQTQPLKFKAWYRDIATNELDCKMEDEMMDIYVAYCMSFGKPQQTEILSPEAWIAETTKNGDLREVEMLMQQYSDYVLSMQNPQRAILKMIQHSNNGKNWFLVEVPEGVCVSLRLNILSYIKDNQTYGMKLPTGEYSAPKLAKDMDDVEMKGICKLHFDKNYADYIRWGSYKHAKDSFISLLLSHNLRQETTLIIEVINSKK